MSKIFLYNFFQQCMEILVWLLFLFPFLVGAQKSFDFSGQLMQRAELRNGYGKLIAEDRNAAFFIGQRARINAAYNYKGMKFYVSAQDVRIWGSASHIKLTDNFFSVYEAYFETDLIDNWKVKLGRQELNYDNARFLGNLDWAFQGRSHDMALIKYEEESLKLHLGLAFNQPVQSLTAVPYTVENHYKTGQMVHLEDKGKSFDWSFLFWNQGLEQQIFDDNGEIIDWKTRFSQTIGLPVLRYRFEDFTLFGFYYHQLGRNAKNRSINVFDTSAQISWTQSLNKENRHMQITLGAEYLSGNDSNSIDTEHAFNPFYGTNHAHNGYMDYFHVGGRNNSGLGLFDRFLRFKYQASTANFWSLNAHSFASAGDYYLSDGSAVQKYLGTELDLSTGLIINDALSLQFGYSQFLFSDGLKVIQNVENAKSVQNWAYVMLLFRPGHSNRFVGLNF